MNHVAHCFLSYADEGVLLGNFIGDYVKGRAWQDYPLAVQRGILMHRTIDAFTDEHVATRDSIARLRPYAGRYTAPVVDILYDHVLCQRWAEFSPGMSFDDFARWVYRSLDRQHAGMPPALYRRWPVMKTGRFLQGYHSRRGLNWVLHQFSARLGFAFDPGTVSRFFFAEMELFSRDFSVLFPELQQKVRQEYF